ncbi:carbohydrate ABC transporter permease [Homoserinibacter sp. GY 40078]|uniref:carbohydrate ABC transporter permease n=1 Tax=Homoserinibacter sp. GY 40078 TaxID=2603275 RepID=UPI0011C92F06|nr:sugar ABC transporter permease [Homoserinibacter sp. GY 40078]TXK19270.1 sugar ABC transporter permease [Homoserinibacter sp. GY 40078]
MSATSNGARIAPRRTGVPYLLIVPAILALLLGLGYPLVWQFITAFQEYGLAQQFGKAPDWVGFANFGALVSDGEFWAVLVRSLLFCVVTAFATVLVGVLLALLMNAIGRAARLTLQISLLLAWATPVAAATTIFIWLFDRRRGVVNYLLDLLPGVDMNRYDWLGHPLTFFFVASILIVWMSVPFVAFAVYAGLTQVSEEVLEAAQLDGAGGWQRYRLIIGPMIRPVLSIVLLLQLIWDLRVFAQITLLKDAGSKSGDFDLLGTYIYKLGASANDFGMASAVSIVVLIITLAISWVYVRDLLAQDKETR